MYEIHEADLSGFGHRRFIWDGIFQELDIESGNVIFQWRASDHVPLTSSYRPIGLEGSKNNPWDWFHINSVEKDVKGNYLLSSRYLEGLLYVSGTTGDVLWYLGGKHSNFTDLSGGSATNFSFQHHARWASEKTIILFDNAIDYENSKRAPYSRGLHLELDFALMTARCLAEYVSPTHYASPSQGSIQILPNDNIFIGYGDLPVYIEFLPEGTAIRETHFGPAVEFGSDNVQSYRVYKQAWSGHPNSKPDIAVRGNCLYASWNGATEIKWWRLQHANDANAVSGTYSTVRTQAKAGFETKITIDDHTTGRFVRLIALDLNGAVLGTSRTIDWAEETVCIFKSSHPPRVSVARELINVCRNFQLDCCEELVISPACSQWHRSYLLPQYYCTIWYGVVCVRTDERLLTLCCTPVYTSGDGISLLNDDRLASDA